MESFKFKDNISFQLQNIGENNFKLILFLNETEAGFCRFRKLKDDSYYFEAAAIMEKFRNQKLGINFIEQINHFLKSKKAIGTLIDNVTNSSKRSVYQRYGWKNISNNLYMFDGSKNYTESKMILDLPLELHGIKEIKGVEYGDLNLGEINKSISNIKTSLEKKYEPGEKKSQWIFGRLENLKDYFSYPLYYIDIFDTDHIKRREWRMQVLQKNIPAKNVYEKQRIKSNERGRINDLEFLAMMLFFDYPEIESIKQEIENYVQTILLNAEEYGKLNTAEKIEYIEEFDTKICDFLNEIERVVNK